MTGRGEIWWADVDKRRPVLIVHNDKAAARIGYPLVAPITTTYRGSTHLQLGPNEGLGRSSWANLDAIQPLDRRLLLRKAGQLDATGLKRLCDLIRRTVGC